jgi:hypothetical protein
MPVGERAADATVSPPQADVRPKADANVRAVAR